MSTPIDISAGKRRRRKREIRPEIDRRAERPFNGDTATRVVADPYSTTGGKIAVTASLRDDSLGKLYARRQIDEAQYRVGLMLTEFSELTEIGSVQAPLNDTLGDVGDAAKTLAVGEGSAIARRTALAEAHLHSMMTS